MNIKEEANKHRLLYPDGCPYQHCDVCISIGKAVCMSIGKCAMDGCGSGRLLGSVYCENHDQDPPAGRKYDKDKPRYDLIPFKALNEVVAVLTYGAKKYAPENWRKVEGWRWRYFGAALRHMVAWFGGERVDPESGHKHLAHAVCCLMFALELDL